MVTVISTAIRISPFRKLQMNWEEVAVIDFQNSEMRVTTKEGRERKISLRQVENKEEVKAIFKKWADEKRGITSAVPVGQETKEN